MAKVAHQPCPPTSDDLELFALISLDIQYLVIPAKNETVI